MFDSSQPPLLVQPISMRNTHTTLFPSHGGYCVNFIDEAKALVSYTDGWTFPLSNMQQKYVSEPPLLLVRDSGCVTTASSTVTKGYAHQFCQDDGTGLVFHNTDVIFPDQPDIRWMLIPDTITMIWLQYGNKNQFCGESGHDIDRIYYGKLLIRKFVIEEDFAPRLGKNAVAPVLSAKQYRVHSHQIYKEDWSLIGQNADDYLKEVLTSQKLERYKTAVAIALKRAGYSH